MDGAKTDILPSNSIFFLHTHLHCLYRHPNPKKNDTPLEALNAVIMSSKWGGKNIQSSSNYIHFRARILLPRRKVGS